MQYICNLGSFLCYIFIAFFNPSILPTSIKIRLKIFKLFLQMYVVELLVLTGPLACLSSADQHRHPILWNGSLLTVLDKPVPIS